MPIGRERVTNGQLVGGGLPSFTWITTDLGTTNYVSAFKEYSISGTTETLVRTDTIEYDANGNITKYGDVTYEYDKLGRLTKETNPTIDRVKEWCYDVGGNITSRTERRYTTNQNIGTYTYVYDTSWKDQLKSYNGQAIEYDAAGNPTIYRGNTLTWERGRLLTGYNSIEMEYDADGIRCKKQVPSSNTTITYTYQGNNLIQEKIVLENGSQSSTTTQTFL